MCAAVLGALSLGEARGELVYEATLTGSFVSIDFDGADPGPFASLDAGDTYIFTFRVDATPQPGGAGTVTHAVLSAALTIDHNGTPMSIGPASGGELYVSAVPDESYLFAIRQTFDALPFGSVRFALLDSDGDPVSTSTDLPLDLDLDAFTGQRELALVGDVDIGTGHLFPIAHASVDGFSARFIPAPGAAGMLACGGAWVVRRRRGAR